MIFALAPARSYSTEIPILFDIPMYNDNIKDMFFALLVSFNNIKAQKLYSQPILP